MDQIEWTAGSRASLQWTAAPGATRYNVHRGVAGTLPRLLTTEPDSCLAAVASGTTTGDTLTESPAPGGLFWYLVRAANFCGEGPAGSASAGPRSQEAHQCDDGVPCTADACEPEAGCVNSPTCDDGDPCTAETCTPVGCSYTPVCDDGDPCTSDSCSPGGICSHAPACDDGDLCTDDSCGPGGVCSHVPTDCDDGDPCTVDSCGPGGICSHAIPPQADHLVISQVQVGGDHVSLPADDEFIELFNPTDSALSLAGLSVQLKLAVSSTYSVNVLPADVIPAHGWYLIARAEYNGSPPADTICDAFRMPEAGGNLFLVNGTSPLPLSSCSSSASIIDKLAWGGANCPENTAVAAPAANNSVLRRPGGVCGSGFDTTTTTRTSCCRVPRSRTTGSPRPFDSSRI